jgi:hypothetical protein
MGTSEDSDMGQREQDRAEPRGRIESTSDRQGWVLLCPGTTGCPKWG